MLTNDTQRAIRDNIVTDTNANVTDPTPGRARVLSPEAALLLNRSVVAKPLMVPEVCSIHIKNTEYRYRWVNAQGKNGSMYMQRRAQGFTNATTDDVELLGGDAVATNGEIRAGDLILMKLRYDLYDAAMKYNMEKAMLLQRTRGMYIKNASSDVFSDAVPQRDTIATALPNNSKTSPFIPDNPDALVAHSSQGEARAQITEIREHAKNNPDKTIVGKSVQDR